MVEMDSTAVEYVFNHGSHTIIEVLPVFLKSWVSIVRASGQVPQNRKTTAGDGYNPLCLSDVLFLRLTFRFTQPLEEGIDTSTISLSGEARSGPLVMKQQFRCSPRLPNPVRPTAAVYVRSPGN